MPKRYYQIGEPCDKCGTPTIPGKDGYGYCKPCYVAWKNQKEQMRPTQGGYAPQPYQNAKNAPTRPQYAQPAPLPIQPNTEALEAKVNAQTQKINNLQFAVHSLWAVLISGDPEKERNYEIHKEPTVAQSKIVEPTEEELGF